MGNNDYAGVHTNSGVNNKAAYLMANGGIFNGKTVIGLGNTKVAHIYYEVQTLLLTSGSDYADLYNALYQGCLNLAGSFGIVVADCQQVRNATDAVAMNKQPTANPNYNPDAPLCPAGQIVENTVFFDDLESGDSNWSYTRSGPANGWRYDSPYGNIAHSGKHFLYADDYPAGVSDSTVGLTTGVTIPPNAYLHFAHFYGFAYGTLNGAPINSDGGVVEYSINNGAGWIGAGSLFQVNGYNGLVSSGYGNPLSGNQAFVRESRLYTSSRLNLASLAGQSVRFRWRIGLDNIPDSYYFGWYLDDIRIYTCISLQAAPPRNYYTNGTPTLTWNRVTDATQYEVQVSKSSTFGVLVFPPVIVPSSKLSIAIGTDNVPPDPLTTDGVYYWRVRAIRNGVPGVFSPFESFTIDLP